MDISILNKFSKESDNEYNQVDFWFLCLNEIKTQNHILKETVNSEIILIEKGEKPIKKIIKDFTDKTISYIDEPSQICSLTNLFIGLIDTFTNILSENIVLLNSHIDKHYSRINDHVNSLSKTILDKTNQYFDLINNSKGKFKAQYSKYMKLQEELGQAYNEKKITEMDTKSYYNIQLKDKVELNILLKLKAIKDFKPHLKSSFDDYQNKKEMLNCCMRENFESLINLLVLCNQRIKETFLELGKNKNDLVTKSNKYCMDRIEKLKEVDLLLNNHAEIKYAESKGIIFNYDVEKLLESNVDNEIENNLIHEGEDLITFSNNALECFSIRAQVINCFNKLINEFYLYVNNLSEEYTKININFQSIIQSLTYIGPEMKKSWDLFKTIFDICQKIHSNFSKLLSTSVLVSFEKINLEYKNEINDLKQNWSIKLKEIERVSIQYEEILITNRSTRKSNSSKKVNENAKPDQANNEKLNEVTNKFRGILSESKVFINNHIKLMREKESKRINIFLDNLDKIGKFYENLFFQLFNLFNMHLDMTRAIDVYSDVKETFQNYIKKFQISENYFNKILIKNFQFYMENQNASFLNINNDILSSSKIFLQKLKKNESSKKEDKVNKTLSDKKSDDIIENKNELNISESWYAEEMDEGLSNINDEHELIEVDHIISFVRRDSQYNIDDLEKTEKRIKENELAEYIGKLEKMERLDTDAINQINFKDQIFYDNLFYIENDEKVIDSFNCAYEDSILLQGVLYITNKKLFFNSWFNNKTLFGSTKLLIPLTDIVKIEKQYNCKIFDNSILITTKKVELFFTSFVFRDKCYENLNELIYQCQNNIKEDLIMIKDENEEIDNILKAKGEFSIINNPQNKSIKSKVPYIISNLKKFNFVQKLNEMTERNKKFFEAEKLLKPQSEFSKTYFNKEVIGNLPLPIIFKQLFDVRNSCHEMGKGKNFWESLFEYRDDRDIKLLDEDLNNIPSFYQDLDYFYSIFLNFDEENKVKVFMEELDKWPLKSNSYIYNLTHPVKKKVMLGPEIVQMKEEIKIFFISPKLFIVEVVNHSSGFMYSDTFHTVLQYIFETNYIYDHKEEIFKFITNYTNHFSIVFTKSCFFKGMIEKEGYRESQEGLTVVNYSKFRLVFDTQIEIFNEKYRRMNEEHKNRLRLDVSNDGVYNDNIILQEQEKDSKFQNIHEINFQIDKERKKIMKILSTNIYGIVSSLHVLYLLLNFLRFTIDIEKVYNLLSLAFLVFLYFKFNHFNNKHNSYKTE